MTDIKHESHVFEPLLGKTLTAVRVTEDKTEVRFDIESGETWLMAHAQDCCETVYLEDVVGDFADIIGSPLIVAMSVSADDPSAYESGTWTFYKFGTEKGWVDLRWSGYSNGYYSESVYFCAENSDD